MVNNKEYLLYHRIITDTEASTIFNNLNKQLAQEVKTTKSKSKRKLAATQVISSAQWKKDETLLLQYIILSKLWQEHQDADKFTEADWQKIAQFIPGRS